MGDRRPSMAAALSAFGVPATVTRLAPDDSPVSTCGIWMSPRVEQEPFGSDFQKIGARKVFALQRSALLPNAPRGTAIVAAEFDGGDVKSWRVDGYDGPLQPDSMRLILVETVSG